MKPFIDIDRFRQLDLRVGTVTAVRHHPSIGDLKILTVHLEAPVEVLAVALLAAGTSPGDRVVVANGLHPLSAGGERFTASLMTVTGLDGSPAAFHVLEPIPDGSRLS